jgi:ribosomal protein S3
MGQKVNPISLRLGTPVQKWNSNWHTSNNNAYGLLLAEDIEIRRYINSVFENKDILINKININRNFKQIFINIEIYSEDSININYNAVIKTISNYTKMPVRFKVENLLTQPNLKNKIEKLKKELGRSLFQFKNNPNFQTILNILLITVIQKQSANLLAKYISKELEKTRRHVFFLTTIKRIINIILAHNQNILINGIRIDVKGRLNGADRSRKETIKHGSVPLQTLSSHIDFSLTEAFTIYGAFGIKVWVSYKK